LRGVAVAVVVLYHLGQTNDLGWFHRFTQGGFLGVSAFFTLSGYLITSLLILEFESVGFVNLGGFWPRRLRRLMPASLLTLAVVLVLTPLIGTASQLQVLPGQIWSAIGYVFNWHQILSGNEYAASFNAPSPLNHFWSLAVEEQAYLVVPFVVAITMKLAHRRSAVAGVFSVITALSFLAMVVLGGGEYSNRVYLGTDTRVGELAIGGVLAALSLGGTGRLIDRFRSLLPVASIIATVGLVLSWSLVPIENPWLYRGGFSIHGAAICVIIAAITSGTYPLARILESSALVELGKISYGVYLFHWPIMLWLTPDVVPLAAVVIAVMQVALTISLAIVSYHVFERPVRFSRLITGNQRAVVPLVALAVLAAGAAVLPDPDDNDLVALESVGGVVDAAPQQRDSAEAAAATRPLRLLVMGDSFAKSIGIGFEQLAALDATVSVYNRGLVGCPFGTTGWNRGIGLERQADQECLGRPGNFEESTQLFEPDVVLAAGGMWDIADRRPDGFADWTHVGDPAYDDFLRQELGARMDEWSAHGAMVVWLTAPTFSPIYNPEMYMAKPPYSEAEPGRSERFNELVNEAAALRTNVVVVDLATWMKNSPGGEFSPDLRIDGVHFTRASSVTAARWLLGEIETAWKAKHPEGLPTVESSGD